MNRQFAKQIGFESRLGELTKQAGFMSTLGRVAGAVGRGAGTMATRAKAIAGPAAANVAKNVGQSVGGMQPGLGRRILAGSQNAAASPLTPTELGKNVLGRAGVAGGAAALAGGSYLKGEHDAANEARRRASQMGFMQRLAFLANPNIVNQM